MERLLTYENFEIEDNKNNSSGKKEKKSHSCAKIIILLILIVIFEIIYLISIKSRVFEKNDELTRLNFKKYLLDTGNKKLDLELTEAFITKYSLIEDINKTEKEINTKETNIEKYINMSSYLLNNYSPTLETLIKIKAEIDDKTIILNQLKSLLNNSNKNFREKYNTIILDSQDELNNIKALINMNNNNINDFNLCYRGENDNINFGEAYDKCDFKKDLQFIILLQTITFQRYGIYISNIKSKNSFIFYFPLKSYDKNKKIKMEKKRIELNELQRQSFIYILNFLQKNVNSKILNDSGDTNDNKDKDIMDENIIKDFKIVNIEIFHVKSM